MGNLIPIDNDVLLVLAVMALIYKESGDKQLLLGLLILLVSLMR